MNRQNVIILAILAILILFLVLSSKKEQKEIKRNIDSQKKTLFHDFNPELVETIQITNNKKKSTVTFKKQENQWIVAEKSFPAEKSFVKNLLKKLPLIRLGHVLAEADETSQKKWGMNTGITVTVNKKKFTLGSKSRSGIALEKDSTIYLSPTDYSYSFKRYDDEYRTKKIFSDYTKDDVQKIVLTKDSETISIERNNNGELSSSYEKLKEKETLEKAVDNLMQLKIKTFLEKQEQHKTEPMLTVNISFKDGKTSNLIINKPEKEKKDPTSELFGQRFNLSSAAVEKVMKLFN